MQQEPSTTMGTITVVSGLPRSGTSMMMQMLERGGLELYSDNKREADESNPYGYFEHVAVKSLARDNTWLPEAVGKVVKIVANLLPHVPADFSYRVIFMERDIREVLASQQSMLERMGKRSRQDVYPDSLAKQFGRMVENAREWAVLQPNVQILHVPHRDVIVAPLRQANRVTEFLDHEVDPNLMVRAVDPELHREKA